MVCEPDETDLDIHIPAVMLPQDAGVTLEKMLSNGSSGEVNSLGNDTNHVYKAASCLYSAGQI